MKIELSGIFVIINNKWDPFFCIVHVKLELPLLSPPQRLFLRLGDEKNPIVAVLATNQPTKNKQHLGVGSYIFFRENYSKSICG